MKIVNCPVCDDPNAEEQIQHDPVATFFVCPVCGRYEFTDYHLFGTGLNMNKLAPYLFYNGFKRKRDYSEYRYHTTLAKEKCDEYVSELKKGNNTHGHPVHIDNDIINAWYPRSFAEKIDEILLKLYELTDYVGKAIQLSKYELYSLFFVERYKVNGNDKLGEEEMNKQVLFYMDYLKKAGLIQGDFVLHGDQLETISIAPDGYQRIDLLHKNMVEGREAFVAMKFGSDTSLLREKIKEGIRDAGYNPIVIDDVEHNDFIIPELLRQIKNSKFIVVDLTHKNNGAYFEEGYALGLGKPVIQLCRKGTKLHFDIAQKNTIMWETESDIPLRLKNRIKATID